MTETKRLTNRRCLKCDDHVLLLAVFDAAGVRYDCPKCKTEWSITKYACDVASIEEEIRNPTYR